MLSETHIDRDVLESEILACIPEFTIFRGDRNGRNCGGVAMLVHNIATEPVENHSLCIAK